MRRFTFISSASERVVGVPAAAVAGTRLDDCPFRGPLRDAIERAANQARSIDVGRAECTDCAGRRLRIRVVRERDHSAALLGVIEHVLAAPEDAELLERMVSVVSHDLRNPLSAILVTAQLLSEARVAPAIARIQRSALRMQKMIGDILDVSRLRHAGGLPIEPQPCDLGELIAEQIDELQQVYPDRTLLVTTSGTGGGTWDPGRISELLSNLIGNALGHSTGDAVQIQWSGGDDAVELRIRNRGEIPAADLPTIFEPFRVGARTRPGSGLGLGLFISRAIVEAHGGTITAVSADGMTEMIVRLPRQRSSL